MFAPIRLLHGAYVAGFAALVIALSAPSSSHGQRALVAPNLEMSLINMQPSLAQAQQMLRLAGISSGPGSFGGGFGGGFGQIGGFGGGFAGGFGGGLGGFGGGLGGFGGGLGGFPGGFGAGLGGVGGFPGGFGGGFAGKGFGGFSGRNAL
jgi:hypothetical protein